MNTSSPTSTTSPTSFFGSSFFSSVTSSVNAISQTIQTKGIPEINKRLNEIQQKARELPNQLATLQGDLESERALFVQSKKLDEKNGQVRQAKGSGIDAKHISICISC
jgi:DNA integrity scanning protein DisA with diadenylate cyclase activity